MKKYIYIITALLAIPGFFVSAMTFKSGDNIAEKDYIDDSAFFTGKNITIDSDINGDLFVFGDKVVVNGKVNGDIIGAAGELVINQEVQGNLRFAGKTIEVKNNVLNNVTIATETFSVRNGARMGRDVAVAAKDVTIEGSIDGMLDIASSSADIKGRIGKGLNFYSDASDTEGVTISPEAVVNGDINYNAFGDVKGVEAGKNVLGNVNKKVPVAEETSAGEKAFALIGFLVSLVLVIYVIIFVGGRNVKDIQKAMISNPSKATGLGAIMIFGLPILSLVFIISGFGMFLGFVGIVIWLLLIPFSILLSVIAFGEVVATKIRNNISGKIYYTSLIGIILSFIIFKIPLLGFLMIVFFMWWGSGGLLVKFMESRSDDIVIRKKEIDIIEEKKEEEQKDDGKKE
ncbi:MAG: hypothetical protein PHW52_02465 [Candidatus Pacebacteria bacterium]|nr:hypothetical protein [Candidatus Paceibacterota bacterium]